MGSARRVVAVTVGLFGTGAILGALAGASALVALEVMSALVGDGFGTEDLLFGVVVGAPLGAVTLPTLAWLLLRRVPLGRMFVWSVAGTIVGALLGWFSSELTAVGGNSLEHAVNSGVVGAWLGCVAACVLLRHRCQNNHG